MAEDSMIWNNTTIRVFQVRFCHIFCRTASQEKGDVATSSGIYIFPGIYVINWSIISQDPRPWDNAGAGIGMICNVSICWVKVEASSADYCMMIGLGCVSRMADSLCEK